MFAARLSYPCRSDQHTNIVFDSVAYLVVAVGQRTKLCLSHLGFTKGMNKKNMKRKHQASSSLVVSYRSKT